MLQLPRLQNQGKDNSYLDSVTKKINLHKVSSTILEHRKCLLKVKRGTTVTGQQKKNFKVYIITMKLSLWFCHRNEKIKEMIFQNPSRSKTL